MIKALDGVPTIISGSKQFLAYQKGAVDVGMTGTSAVKSRKLYEVMNYLTLSFDSAIEFVAIINNDLFESLPSKHQKIILNAARIVELPQNMSLIILLKKAVIQLNLLLKQLPIIGS